jgi:hypothetical protein
MFSIDAQAQALGGRAGAVQTGTREPRGAGQRRGHGSHLQALATAERALQGAIALPTQDRITSDVAAALDSSEPAQPGAQAAQPKPRLPSILRPPDRFCMDCGVKLEG